MIVKIVYSNITFLPNAFVLQDDNQVTQPYISPTIEIQNAFSSNAYLQESKVRISLFQPPPWEPEAYKLIDRIAADEGRFTNNNEV